MQRKIIESPLSFFGPAAVIMELDDLSPVLACKFAGLVSAVGIDNDDFSDACQRFKAARKVLPFVANGNDDGYRQIDEGSWATTLKFCDSVLHVEVQLHLNFWSWRHFAQLLARCCTLWFMPKQASGGNGVQLAPLLKDIQGPHSRPGGSLRKEVGPNLGDRGFIQPCC